MSFRCEYSDEHHRYTFHENGTAWHVPSVTQTLTESGVSVYPQTLAMQLAKQRGTAVHAAIQAWLENEPFPIEYGAYVQAFRQWASAVSFKPMFIEKKVWSRRYGYAGRMDILGYVNGMLSVVDIKPISIPKWVNLQLAALVQAANESIPQCRCAWLNRYAVGLGADGRSRMQAFDKQDLDFWTFHTHLKKVKEQPQWKLQTQSSPHSSQQRPNSTSARTHRSKSRSSSSSRTTSSTKQPHKQPKNSKAS